MAVESKDLEAAVACLHPDVRFRSPAVFRSYVGRESCALILRNVFVVFEDFAYTDEIAVGNRSVLFFQARVGDKTIEGIDDLTVDADELIVDFRVMVRPLSGALALAEAMAARLQTGSAE